MPTVDGVTSNRPQKRTISNLLMLLASPSVIIVCVCVCRTIKANESTNLCLRTTKIVRDCDKCERRDRLIRDVSVGLYMLKELCSVVCTIPAAVSCVCMSRAWYTVYACIYSKLCSASAIIFSASIQTLIRPHRGW
jgi:hypothetical protein